MERGARRGGAHKLAYGAGRETLWTSDDERTHRDEAAAALRSDRPPGAVLRGWCALVGRGSAAAVVLARRI